MKRIFRTFVFVAMISATPFVFTSCGDLAGVLGDLMEEMEKEEGDDEGDDNYFDSGDNVPSDEPTDSPVEDVPMRGESEIIEIPVEGLKNIVLLDLCVNLTHEYKYTINGLEDCDWARVEWVQGLNGNIWTPLLTVDENTTGETRSVNIVISLGENHICQHTIYQYN